MNLNNFYPEGDHFPLEHAAAINTVGNKCICVESGLVFHLTGKATGRRIRKQTVA
jgi:hypothetical protein